MKETTQTIWTTLDGKPFTNKAEAEKHEAAILERAERMSYWTVAHGPDLTEGRGMQCLTVLEVYTPDFPDTFLWVEDFCYRTYGRRIQFVQGVSPVPGWILKRLDNVEQALQRMAPRQMLGSSRYKPQWLYLSQGPLEDGLVSKELKEYPHVAPIPAG